MKRSEKMQAGRPKPPPQTTAVQKPPPQITASQWQERRVINKNPYPDAPLNHLCFPLIMDTILEFHESWIPMRSTSRAFRRRVDVLIFANIVIRKPYWREYTEGPVWSHMWNDPLLILNHHGRLPLFPVRSYELGQMHPWKHDKSRWTPLLMSNTKVIDVHFDALNDNNVRSLSDCFPKLETIRLVLWDTSSPIISRPLSVLRADWQCFIESEPTKLVLFPSPPIPWRPKRFYNAIDPPKSTRKVVSNILYSDKVGTLFLPLTIEGQMPRRSTSLTDIVFNFETYPEDHLKARDGASSHGQACDSIQRLAREISGLLRLRVAGQASAPAITVVDLPQTARFTSDYGRRLPKGVSTEEFFKAVITFEMNFNLHIDSTAYKKPVSQMLQKIKFLTRDEYAASLEPGELAIETERNL